MDNQKSCHYFKEDDFTSPVFELFKEFERESLTSKQNPQNPANQQHAAATTGDDYHQDHVADSVAPIFSVPPAVFHENPPQPPVLGHQPRGRGRPPRARPPPPPPPSSPPCLGRWALSSEDQALFEDGDWLVSRSPYIVAPAELVVQESLQPTPSSSSTLLSSSGGLKWAGLGYMDNEQNIMLERPGDHNRPIVIDDDQEEKP